MIRSSIAEIASPEATTSAGNQMYRARSLTTSSSQSRKTGGRTLSKFAANMTTIRTIAEILSPTTTTGRRIGSVLTHTNLQLTASMYAHLREAHAVLTQRLTSIKMVTMALSMFKTLLKVMRASTTLSPFAVLHLSRSLILLESASSSLSGSRTEFSRQLQLLRREWEIVR